MAQVQQRVLAILLAGGLMLPAWEGPRFYDDDPVWQLPEPVSVGKLKRRKASDIYDFFEQTFGKPGEKHLPGKPVPAQAVNTLGEVPDNEWYVNRHGFKRMSIEELVRGPGNENPPRTDATWQIVAAKTEGVTPGFTIKDSTGQRYQLKFDTHDNFEMVTGADVMGSKFFHAFGYHTPENYIVFFDAKQLQVPSGTKWVDKRGHERDMREEDLEDILKKLPRTKDGKFRAVASRYLKGEPIGPFRWHGLRSDDPNDFIPHEHRRDLRGARIFYSWVNHSDAKGLNSLDTIVEENGKRFVRHHLIDFGAAFGAEAFEPKSPRGGYVHLLDWRDSARTFFTLGLAVPEWARADYKHVEKVGRLESEVFDPAKWKPNYYIPAFENTLPDDAYWAARTIMRFTEPEIRALVSTAAFSSQEGAEYVVKTLVERQQKIGRTYFSKVLPLDNFRVEGGELKFDDLGVQYGFSPARQYTITWSAFDNNTGQKQRIGGVVSRTVPETESRYISAQITAADDAKTVIAWLRRAGGTGWEVVGLDRTWPGGPPVTSAPQYIRTSRR